ncbi:MAG: PQQ-binding-like beta-propeller repeat protein [Candidatus Hydrogenedentes bacterium]|nr:PQQ-binding-like beta-propeller repeat protein [Candidatus Hydrogenedentota bacterium]
MCGDRAGTLFCLNAAGDRLWSTELGGAIETPVVSAALQPESGPVLLAGTRAEELVCLNAMGDILWRTSLGGTMDLGTGIAVGNLDGDGAKETVVTTRNHRVFALGGDGEIRWQFEAGAQFRTTPVLFDIDEDGTMEVFAAPSDWRLYCLKGDGALRWSVNTGSRIDSDPVIVTQRDTASLISTTRGGAISAWQLQ